MTQGWKESRMTPRELAWANCLSFRTVRDTGGICPPEEGRRALSKASLLLQTRNPWIIPKVDTHQQSVVVELGRAIWAADTDFRVISKQVEVEG